MNQPNARPLSGLEMWRAFDSHFKRTWPLVMLNNLQKLRTKQLLKREWKAIAAQDKRPLCQAIHRAGVAERHAQNAALITKRDLKKTGRIGRKAASTQDLLQARVEYLQELATLVLVETQIGATVDDMRAYDDGARIRRARHLVNKTAEYLVHRRQKEARSVGLLKRLRLIGTRRQDFQRERFGRGGGNTFLPFDGGNNETQLGLWVESDANGNIIDRTVIKDVCFEQNKDSWVDPELWRNPLDPLDKMLVEAHVMERLRNAQSSTIVQLRTWSLHAARLVFRMHIEYCPYGDTDKMLDRYRRINAPIPEALIWRIFESLVHAGLMMEQGHLTARQAGWQEIIHMDIKPANVFVGLHPQGNNWACYPEIKLGDYGLALETSLLDARNPRRFWDRGTNGYIAPEQERHRNATERLNAKTNVFGVGITVMQLMSRDGKVGVEDWEEAWKGSQDNEDYPGLPNTALGTYSDDLEELVSECVEFNQRDRPTFGMLRNRIWALTGFGPRDLVRGMRRRTNPQYRVSLGLQPEKFAIGTNVEDDGNDGL